MDFPKLMRVKTDDENMEKIHCAARKGQTELVRRLMEMGIDPAIPNKFGCTALHLACKFGQVETAKELASVTDCNFPWHGQKPLQLAVMAGNVELVKALVEGAKSHGRQIEVMLNECDDNEVTEVGVHHKHLSGQTALHWCVGLGESHLAMLRTLVELGASATCKDKNSETPIMRAIEFKNREAFDILVEHNPQQLRLDICDKNGKSSLMYAIEAQELDMAQRLLNLGIDVNFQDTSKETALTLSFKAAMPSILEYVLENCDPFQVQSAPFHNGKEVLQDRCTWFPWVSDEAAKMECMKLFQKRLEAIIAMMAPEEPKKKKKRAASVKKMMLAPSAPIRK